MTVGQLIKGLQKFDPDAPVLAIDPFGSWWCDVENVDLDPDSEAGAVGIYTKDQQS